MIAEKVNPRPRPWMVAVIDPDEQILFFDDYAQAFQWTQDNPSMTCVIGVAICVIGGRFDRVDTLAMIHGGGGK